MDGGALAYGPVSTLAECLQHVAGCTECKGRWPAVPGMLAMTRRPDGHVDFEVSAAGGGGLVAVDVAGPDVAGPGAEPTGLRLLPDSREELTEPVPQRIEFYQIVWDRRDRSWELRRPSRLRLDRYAYDASAEDPYALTWIAPSLDQQLYDDLDFDPEQDDVEIELTVTVKRRV